MKLQATTNAKIKEFVGLVQSGIESWVKAGQLIVECVDEDPEFIDKLVDQVPGLSRKTVLNFDAIGRGKIEPKVLMSDSPGCRKLLRLPIAEQRRLMAEPVNLLINTESGWETLKVPVENLTTSQSRQVFADDRIRSESEQRSWLADMAAKNSPTQHDDPYRVVGRKLIVMEPCQLTAKQLAQLLAQME